MDPLADKLMLVVTLLLFALRGWTSWIILSLVVAKELVMVVASALLYKKQTVVYSNFWGKAATLLFTVAVVLTFCWTGCIRRTASSCGSPLPCPLWRWAAMA